MSILIGAGIDSEGIHDTDVADFSMRIAAS
jgi:hypothetical protein